MTEVVAAARAGPKHRKGIKPTIHATIPDAVPAGALGHALLRRLLTSAYPAAPHST
ncbi:hypothetical protein [Actinacidiphila epipremni]|uniref:Uncharacterized protein n=1 Tax=Actinacidiphila epipremni TaxID=2053013 RepID=A0ABX0ZYU0_9ACTN|nr:hypothetical protein [Actinacidiphila epipremni]NJP46768.1 hypothetical protein [Actinacidiphila epipremni]